MIVLLVAAVLVSSGAGWVVAAGLRIRGDVRFFRVAMAAVFLLETVRAYISSREGWGWWMYGPVSLVIAALALVVSSRFWTVAALGTGHCPH